MTTQRVSRLLVRIQALISVFVAILVLVIAASPVFAEDNIQSSTVQNYSSDSPLQRGTVVRFNEKANKVLPVSKAQMKDSFGVVVGKDDALVTFSGDTEGKPYQAFVATSGKFNVLVSSQNGPIKINDYVTVSALDGVAMKADETQDTVLGKALASYDGVQESLGKTQLKDKNGKVLQEVNIALLPVAVSIGRNPLAKSVKENLPSALEKAGNAIADKQVNPIRIYISLVVLSVTFVIAATVLYTGVRSSVIAIGRNPLMKKSILKNLFSIILVSMTVLVIGLFAVYLLLKL